MKRLNFQGRGEYSSWRALIATVPAICIATAVYVDSITYHLFDRVRLTRDKVCFAIMLGKNQEISKIDNAIAIQIRLARWHLSIDINTPDQQQSNPKPNLHPLHAQHSFQVGSIVFSIASLNALKKKINPLKSYVKASAPA